MECKADVTLMQSVPPPHTPLERGARVGVREKSILASNACNVIKLSNL